jgi:hypothetical protein
MALNFSETATITNIQEQMGPTALTSQISITFQLQNGGTIQVTDGIANIGNYVVGSVHTLSIV